MTRARVEPLTASPSAERRTSWWISRWCFDDPLAVSIIGAEAAADLQAKIASEKNRLSRALRAIMAVRSRYAEDQLAAAVARGVRQYVVLGAGLDTFAYRNRFREQGLHVFEVDHPATQAWKRELLSAARDRTSRRN